MNALLGEEGVIPASGSGRACTAVVIEIAANVRHTDFTYAAEIDFLEQADWDREVQTLLEDLVNTEGRVSERPSSDSEAGIALAKLQSVYGTGVKPKDMTAARLAQDTEITRWLGRTKLITDNRCKTFRYVEASLSLRLP